MTKDKLSKHYLVCKDCGKKFMISHKQELVARDNNRPLPVRCKECRIGNPQIEDNKLTFKGKRSIAVENGKFIIKKRDCILTKPLSTDFLQILKLCTGIIPNDPDGLIMKFYNTFVNHT